MKKGLVFFLGMIVGALVAVAVMSYIGSFGDTDATKGTKGVKRYSDPGISMFDAPGDKMDYRSFQVMQVLSNGTALMHAIKKSKPGEFDFIAAAIVLMFPDEGVSYYDDQIVLVPSDKCVRQVGTYRYDTKNFLDQQTYVKTVPIVKIMAK